MKVCLKAAAENVCTRAISVKDENEGSGACNIWSVLNPTSYSAGCPVYSMYCQVRP